MKIGFRKPSLKGRISARISPKRYIRHSLGIKAPRGMGFVTDPKKAIYNRIYNRVTVPLPLMLGRSSLAGILLFALVLWVGFKIVAWMR